MEWLWTWGGKCFGYKDDNGNLWTYSGYHVGRFEGDFIYGRDGKYLGELIEGRLISNNCRKNLRSSSFSAYGKVCGYAKFANYVGYVMYSGCQDFPSVEELIK